MANTKILVADDETAIVDVLVYNLKRENFEVTSACDGREAVQKCQSSPPDLIILDRMMPHFDGIQVCQKLRNDPRTQGIRILMLTAKGEETDEIVGFSVGADDYVSKPFRMKVLIERVKALLRRRESPPTAGGLVVINDIEIDSTNHTVFRNGQELTLTPTEFRLLWTLGRQPGRTFSRHELLDCCRGEDANSMERTIDVHVRALRKKLDDLADIVETVRGIGYRCRPKSAGPVRPREVGLNSADDIDA